MSDLHMGTLQGVPPERMLRAPGTSDTDNIGCTTFILFLRCVAEAFITQRQAVRALGFFCGARAIAGLDA